jgi:ELWxxDGT repeat protein
MQNLPIDALRQAWQDGAAMNENEKQFSFTRAASITSGRAQKQIFISSVWRTTPTGSRRKRLPTAWIVATLVGTFTAAWAEDRALLVKDIFPGEQSPGFPNSSGPSRFTEFKGLAYFSANDGTNGTELWVSDGTELGTYMVKDINPGPTGSAPGWLTPLGDFLYFTANQAGVGIELWRTDGTEANTILVADIASGSNSSNPQYLTALNDTLFFSARTDTFGRELWTHNPQSVTTAMVADTWQGTNDGFNYSAGTGHFAHNLVGTARGLFFYRGTTGTSTNDDGIELHVSNGFTANQVTNLATLWGDSLPNYLVTMNDTLYFCSGASPVGGELYRSDGTAVGTYAVKDVVEGTGSSSPQNATVVNNRLYFAANNITNGSELWVTDGSGGGTYRVTDINPGTGNASPTQFRDCNGVLYFAAYNPTSGEETWVVDGPGQPARFLKDINPGSQGSGPIYFRAKGPWVYFQADDYISGKELWRTDGTLTNTTLFSDIWPGSSGSSPAGLTRIGNKIFFNANDGVTGNELWVIMDDAAVFLAPFINPGASAVTATSITWTWQDDSANESGFRVYRVAGAGGSGTLVHTTMPDQEAWVDSGLEPNTQYTFQVSAFNEDGESEKTPPFTVWTLPAIPAAPVFSNRQEDGFAIALGLGDGNPSATEYAIGITCSGCPVRWANAAGTLSPTETWQTNAAWGTTQITGLAPGTAYQVHVKARNGGDTGAAVGPVIQIYTVLGFHGWVASLGLPLNRRGPTDRNGPLSLPNLLAYALGINPLTALPEHLPAARLESVGGVLHLIYMYRQSKTATGIEATIVSSDGLGSGSWDPSAGTVVQTGDASDGQATIWEFRSPTSSSQRFFRLQVR